MFVLLLVFAVSPTDDLASLMPPTFSFAKAQAPGAHIIAPCGMGHQCECGCNDGGLCTCRPDGMKARSLPPYPLQARTYAEWKAGLRKRPVVTVIPPVQVYRSAPAFQSFTPSFGGAACRGGG